MKKTYLFLIALMTIIGAALAPAQADETVEFQVWQSTGFWTKWNGNAANSWASQWQSTQTNPQITITHTNNNMRFWDGDNIMFFSHVGGTNGQTYYFTVSTGWYIAGMSLDFTCGEVTGVVGDASQGVSVSLNGEEAVDNYSSEDFEHVEVTGLENTEVTMTVTSINGSSCFANTKNFIITLGRQTGLAVAEAEFLEILHKYDSYEEDDFQVGTAPGLYDADARDAFFAAIEAGHGIDAIPVDQLTEELYEQLGNAIEETYQALVASRNITYTLPAAGQFYRVRAAMIYVNDGEEVAKYLMAKRNGDTYNATWGTPDDADALQALQTLWSITPNVSNFDMVSAYCEGRFNNVATSNAVTLSTDGDNMMAFDPVYTDEDGQTLINIRVATQEANNYFYLHQGGHRAGQGTGGNIVGWSSTWTFYDGPAATEWVLEPVDDAEATAIIEAGAAAVLREAFENNVNEVARNANLALAASQADMTATNLITSAEQLTSPWSDSDEGQDLGALIDGDATTYWHSDWHSGTTEAGLHYVQVALNEPTHELVRLQVTRRQVSNDHVTAWTVTGSNDADADEDDWQPVAALITPYGSNTETVNTRAFDTKGFKYLRLYFAATTTGRGYGHAAELQLQALAAEPGSQYAAIATQAQTLTDKLADIEFLPIEEVTDEQGMALEEAYNAFRAVYIDPADLRAVIAKAEGLAEGIVVGTNPGYWTNSDLANALTAILDQAKAYDEAGTYTAEQSNAYIEQLNAAMAPVMDAAIGISEGKWYNIRFGSKETFEENNWDLEAGNEVTSTPEEGADPIVVDEALWDKIVTIATYTTDDETGEHFILPIDADDATIGNTIHVDDTDDIEDADLALFRFISVGDTAYVIQNKATGLFLHTGVTGSVTLDLHPSLFNVRAIGYGQNVIAATDLLGANNNNLHIQRSYNLLVTWNADTPGSRSGLYLDPVADVAADYDGTAFTLPIREGEIHTFCYPVDIAMTDDTDGEMWTVNAATDNTVTLARIDKAVAGRPFIFIAGDTDDYDADADANPTIFAHGYDLAPQPDTDHALRGTYVTFIPGPGFLIVNEAKRNALTVSHAMMENSTVGAHQAYIATTGTATGEIQLIFSDEEDGIATALANVARTGNIYTLDGRLVARGNLNTISRLTPGIYVINGTKVAVK